MQFYSKIRFRSALWALICFCMLCSCGTDKPDVSDIQVDTKLERFDHDLSAMISKSDAITTLKDKYGLFYETFTFKILQIRPGSDEEVSEALRSFVTDSSVSSVSLSIDSVYKDTREIEDGFNEFAKHYKYYYPQDTFPRIVACNTFFNYAIAIDSGFIGLGLDMFLGENSHYYEMIGMPLFMRKR
ncbi:MAG: gliding motility lipoprotein GldB, partial [Bacteroidota bacterium]